MAPVFDEKRGATAFTLLLSVRADHFENTPITLTARLPKNLQTGCETLTALS